MFSSAFNFSNEGKDVAGIGSRFGSGKFGFGGLSEAIGGGGGSAAIAEDGGRIGGRVAVGHGLVDGVPVEAGRVSCRAVGNLERKSA